MRIALLFACAVAISSLALAADEESGKPSSDKMLVVPAVEPRAAQGDKAPASNNKPSAAVTPAPAESAPAPSQEESGQGESQGEAQDPDLPEQAYPVSRYAPVWERSPFQVESTAPPPESKALSQSYALTGIAQINGEPIIFVMDRATQMRHMIDKKKGFNDLSLVQVDVQKEYAKSSATISKGGEVGVIQFEAVAAGPMVPQPGAPMPGQMPGRPGLRPGMPVPVPAIPAAPQAQAQPVPGVVPAVPTPVDHQVQQPGTGQSQPPPRVIRRRAVVPAAP